MITCDNGIAAFDPVKKAKDLGMEVIVTDHHEVPYQMEEGRKKRDAAAGRCGRESKTGNVRISL